jgi:hypothetical protein
VEAALGVAAAFGRSAFNALDAPRCDALAGFFFAAGFAADPLDAARAGLAVALEAFLSVFFCVFLDIRLPFVAFDGSIIRLLQAMSWQARIE